MRLCLSWLGEGSANLFWAWGRDLAQTPGRPSHSLQWGLWTPDIIYFIFSSIYRSRNLSIVSFYGVGCGSGKDFLNSSIGDAIFLFFFCRHHELSLFSAGLADGNVALSLNWNRDCRKTNIKNQNSLASGGGSCWKFSSQWFLSQAVFLTNNSH